MQSPFSSQTLAEIFRDLYLGERSGYLLLSREDEEKSVHFVRGMILYADSTEPEEDLGPHLVSEGLLSGGALAEAEDSLTDSTSLPELGMALINRGLIGKASLIDAVRSIVDSVVQSVFRWDGGRARFYEEQPAVTIFETDILATIEIILEGISCMSGFEPIHEAMLGLDNRLRIRTPTPIPLEKLALSPAHGFILSRVDGNSSLRDVISILPPGEEEVAAKLLFGLSVLGVIEYEPKLGSGPFQVADILRDHEDRQALERIQEQLIQETYALVRDQSPHEILGVSTSAPRQEIERAYEEQKAQFSRDRILPKVRDKFRSELTVIESRMIESYLTLTQPNRFEPAAAGSVSQVTVQDFKVRVEMDRAKSKLEMDEANRVADRYYAKGRKFMREGDFHNAIQYGKLAISHNSSDARYYSMLGDCLARNPEARWQRMAEENYTKATELDPWNADYWISLGRLYKERGLKLRARRQFEEALKLVPNNSEILKELNALK